jgi:hypothetical protein
VDTRSEREARAEGGQVDRGVRYHHSYLFRLYRLVRTCCHMSGAAAEARRASAFHIEIAIIDVLNGHL